MIYLSDESEALKMLLDTGELLNESIQGLKNDITKQIKEIIGKHDVKLLYIMDADPNTLIFHFEDSITYNLLLDIDRELNPADIKIIGEGLTNIFGQHIHKRTIVTIYFT